MKAICGATAATTAEREQLLFSGGYSATHGVVRGAWAICQHGEELMRNTVARDVASEPLDTDVA